MSVFDHYRPNERPFVEQVLDWVRQVEDNYLFKLTDFLDPREQQIVRQLVGKRLAIYEDGGFPGAERKRLLLTPDYYELDVNDFEVKILQIDYPTKFVDLTHRQVTGTLLNAGLKRQKFGDVVLADGIAQFATTADAAGFIEMNVDRVGKARVRLSDVPAASILTVPEVKWSDEFGIVSSLRFDAVVSEVLGLSRQKAQALVKHGDCKVNHKAITDASFLLEPDDLVSIRGYGRVKLTAILGSTKREKIKIQYGIIR
ncbi:RNA-binding protein [Exiguobacterium sp. SH3S2]|uniref:YlmH family RNA-binding protein n=1 Tax=Exiguobacterium TaxID=33986 RepID=UPI0008777FB4|nr:MULTISPECIES: YlmH/Sll1252 family protein [Exiguobacterium]OGX77991.1 RNA-binding protein [Exiguobacterium sp. SH31]TCI27503.1 RNA-binding protein [Exiguobacterium sp. SH5S4]TCI37417.1 RNA-binding protein [Exiguobacterium sp. SH4S7]TCI45548.1 RNA-binding protein [Exiguobacterium sp. SH5S32]TCI49174.1 RNA-binding protein [Exiguobacterium sp. SH3S3]